MSTAHRIFEVIREAKPPQTKEELIALLEASLALLKLAAYKTCSCGIAYRTRADFERLPLCGSGYQPQFDENGDLRSDVRLELRNCPCRSTLCVEVPCAATCICGKDIGAAHRLVAAYGSWCCPDRLKAAAESANAKRAAADVDDDAPCPECELVGGHDRDCLTRAEDRGMDACDGEGWR